MSSSKGATRSGYFTVQNNAPLSLSSSPLSSIAVDSLCGIITPIKDGGSAGPCCEAKPKPQKRKRKSPTTTTKMKSQLPKLIRLVKQKPVAKSPMFMTSPSSIYAAVCKYNSLLDALHGASSKEEQAGDTPTFLLVLVMIYIYFGKCPIFEREFDAILSPIEANDLSAPVIEEALHRSVRHLCDCECFLRAYQPIREFTFLWRDTTIKGDHYYLSFPSIGGSPIRRRCRVTKENILSGWSCKLLPPSPSSSERTTTSISVPLVYTSPDGMEFNTKTKANNYMNESFSTSLGLEASTPLFTPQTTTTYTTTTASTTTLTLKLTTPLIDTTTKINSMYSPLGLLEELFLDNPWRLLVSTICLNVTTRPAVDKVLHQFLQRWPTADATAEANWEEISEVISILGLGTKRSKGLVRFSKEYLALIIDNSDSKESPHGNDNNNDPFSLTEKQVKSLYMVGEYGWTAYKVFILKELPMGSVKVCDHALQLYVEYQLGRKSLEGKVRQSLKFS